MHPRDAAAEILNSPGSISMTAEGFVGNAWKPRKSPTGIVLKDSEDGSIFISQIRPDSIFLGSDLKVGMELVAINGDPCPKPAWRATHTLQRSTGKVKIVAIRSTSPDKVEWWRTTRMEQESKLRSVGPNQREVEYSVPPLEDENDYTPTYFERLCGILPNRTTRSLLSTAYDRRPTFLRGDNLLPALLPGQKMVRFNSRSNTTACYDPNDSSMKMRPLVNPHRLLPPISREDCE